MSDSDNRNITRNSLFILAEVRLDGRDEEHRVKVRNLSAGGMMGEGPVKVARGERIAVNLRHVGWVDGSVAWVQDNRFGVAFAEDVDPVVIRAPVAGPEVPPARILKRPYSAQATLGPARKII
ncbi:PilZ domain-containing protein [Novosphingobium bradum]|uniref:PilZ domain-containing protein n=1 Tax=Novosphingobium bradum TaxID=1737444 RepID=A0ABV7ITI2_9SPHN